MAAYGPYLSAGKELERCAKCGNICSKIGHKRTDADGEFYLCKDRLRYERM